LADTGAIDLAFCWAHWRGRFYEIAQAGNAPIASEALARIAEICAIEAEIRSQDAEVRHTVRQRRTKPRRGVLHGETAMHTISSSRGSSSDMRSGRMRATIRKGIGRYHRPSQFRSLKGCWSLTERFETSSASSGQNPNGLPTR
jgi:Transposase IS66 family